MRDYYAAAASGVVPVYLQPVFFYLCPLASQAAQCPVCFTAHSNDRTLSYHMEAVHAGQPVADRYFKQASGGCHCIVCGALLKSPLEVIGHLRALHTTLDRHLMGIDWMVNPVIQATKPRTAVLSTSAYDNHSLSTTCKKADATYTDTEVVATRTAQPILAAKAVTTAFHVLAQHLERDQQTTMHLLDEAMTSLKTLAVSKIC